MIRSSFVTGRYVAGEADIVLGSLDTWTGSQPHGVVWAHGSGQLAGDVQIGNRRQLHALARHATVHVGDLGGQTWGSDLAVTRIGQAISFLRAQYGVTGKIALVGGSMGGCNVLNYALRHPEDVACVALGIPLLDIANARANPLLTSRWPEIDAIYGAPPHENYSDHSPVMFAADLDPDLPIRMWTASNDELVDPSTADAFVAARPQTIRTDVGPLGHTGAAFDAATIELTTFVARHLGQ